MAVTSKVLLRTQISTSSGGSIAYTVPATSTAVVTNIAVTNTTATAKTFSINVWSYVVGPGSWTTNPLFSGVAIAANTTVVIDLKQVLNSSDKLVPFASADNSLIIHVSGVEVA